MSDETDLPSIPSGIDSDLVWYDWTSAYLLEACGLYHLKAIGKRLWREERPNVIDVVQSENNRLLALAIVTVPEISLLWTIVDFEYKRTIMHWYCALSLIEPFEEFSSSSLLSKRRLFTLMDRACGKHYTRDSMGNTPGHLLCYRKDMDTLVEIIKPFESFGDELRPLFDLVTVCDKPNAWINTVNNCDFTPLHIIIRSTCDMFDSNLAELLLSTKEVDVNYALRTSRGTCLHMSLLHNKLSVFFACIRHGGDLTLRTILGHTPLDIMDSTHPTWVKYTRRYVFRSH